MEVTPQESIHYHFQLSFTVTFSIHIPETCVDLGTLLQKVSILRELENEGKT